MPKVVTAVVVVVIVGDNGRNDVNEDGEGGGGVRAGDPFHSFIYIAILTQAYC